MKNTLEDLNNHLFAQIERLGDEDLKGDELNQELERAKAVTGVAREIISNGALALNAQKIRAEYNIKTGPKMLGYEDGKK